MQPWLAWNSLCRYGASNSQRLACLCLCPQSAGTEDVCHHTQSQFSKTNFSQIFTMYIIWVENNSGSYWFMNGKITQLRLCSKGTFHLIPIFPLLCYLTQLAKQGAWGTTLGRNDRWNPMATCMDFSSVPTQSLFLLSPSLIVPSNFLHARHGLPQVTHGVYLKR